MKLTHEDWNDLDNIICFILDNLDTYAEAKDYLGMTDEMIEELHTKVKTNLEETVDEKASNY